MGLADYLTPERIVLLAGASKAEALDEVVRIMSASGVGVGGEALSAAVRKREGLMSTGIGQGIAVPHVRMREAPRLAMAVAVCRAGIADYESIDNLPVHVVVLIVAPQGDHEGYIRLLSRTVQVLKDPQARDAIIAAESPQVVCRILTGGRP